MFPEKKYNKNGSDNVLVTMVIVFSEMFGV